MFVLEPLAERKILKAAKCSIWGGSCWGGEAPDAAARAKALKKIALLETKIERSYRERVLGRLGGCAGALRSHRCASARQRFCLASYSAISRLRSRYSLQLKKHRLSSAFKCSFALARLPLIR